MRIKSKWKDVTSQTMHQLKKKLKRENIRNISMTVTINYQKNKIYFHAIGIHRENETKRQSERKSERGKKKMQNEQMPMHAADKHKWKSKQINKSHMAPDIPHFHFNNLINRLHVHTAACTVSHPANVPTTSILMWYQIYFIFSLRSLFIFFFFFLCFFYA